MVPFFEMAINLFYAYIVRFLTLPVLSTLAAVSFVWLVCVSLSSSTLGHQGVYYQLFLGGIPRTAFSFFLGVAIYRAAAAGRLPAIRFPVLGLALLLIIVFAPPSSNAMRNVYYDLICVTLVFPTVLILGYQNTPSGRLADAAALCGALSYPIYLLHYPFYVWYEEFSPLPRKSSIVAAALFVPLISYSLLKWFDEPIRAALSRLLKSAKHRATKPILEGH